MEKLISRDAAALQMLMTEDLYLLSTADVEATALAPHPPGNPTEIAATAPELKAAPTDLAYLGENNKYFLILVDDKSHKELNPTHREMLLKTMSAKGYELRDLAILNLNRYPGVQFSQLREFFACTRLALFGINPQQLGLASLNANLPGNIDNVKILATYSWEELSTDDQKKRAFWAAMKPF